ncbi:MAG: TonB-dependent receptor [Bacteroidales bacterium]|jgi:iron complex outermembrane receptor protein|nr:TonB-dependent receptor [Bacteroidales bacterium]
MNTILLFCRKHNVYRILLLIILGLSSLNANAQFTIRGIITDQGTKKTLSGAHISLENTRYTTISDDNGVFLFHPIKKGSYSIRVSYIGYKTFKIPITLLRDTTLNILLEGTALLGEEVNILATRAQQYYPTTFSTLQRNEIQKFNLAKDMPFILQSTPSTIVTSDAGNGVGYTGISIRGTDLTRINVTINGVPLNDAESQGVWFVDLPDLASSTENIQIQRGVGTSTNGAGAFGASINFLTADLHQDPYGELNLSGGSYGTLKTTVRFGTGLMANKFSVDGRLSYIHSDGYIDRAFSNLKSYYLAGGYYGKNTTLKLLTFSGNEWTYQAWEGVPKDSLSTNRTYNPAGEYIDKNGAIAYYDNQTDNYQQDHYQLIFSQGLSRNWNLSAALHYTKGKGYYENYEQNASFDSYGLENVVVGLDTIKATDLINRKMMDNDFYGLTFSSNLAIKDHWKITLGGAWNRYYGRHFGKIIWARFASNSTNDLNWYYNTGVKTDFNLFGKAIFQVKKLNFFVDLQYRRVHYNLDGTLDDLRVLNQVHLFNFFNPKCGLFLDINSNHNLYFSFGIAHREPSRNNYKDSDPQHIPTFETLQDYELGYTFKHEYLTVNANVYYMHYRDQLVLTGEINNVGEAIMVNVPKSYRLGIEISADMNFFRKKLEWQVSGTFSQNKILNFTQYIDTYDSTWNFSGQVSNSLGTTDLSFSPAIIAGSIITYKPLPQLSFSLNTKFVGQQFIDNTSNSGRALKDYFINGISLAYTLNTRIFKEIGFNLLVSNIFNVKYETNAWVYPYFYQGQYYESNGYFPQALVNLLFGISLKI